MALTVEITGLVLSVSVSRSIAKGLNEINRAATKITKGNLTERATVFSRDEIGQVAISINEMTEQLIRSNMELEQFAYIASHDLQEPLRKIKMFVDRIEEKEEQLSEPAKDYFIRIQNATHRMQLLIENLLYYSRIIKSEANSHIVDLNSLLLKVKEELRDTIQDKKAVIVSDKLPSLSITEFQFQQLFINLLENSFKYQKENVPPHIKISYSVVQNLNVLNVSANGSAYHKISFTDNGIGFEQQYAEKIFILFQRLHARQEFAGTGIGLAICKKIVENHNGFITAISEIGKGATFDIYLPLT